MCSLVGAVRLDLPTISGASDRRPESLARVSAEPQSFSACVASWPVQSFFSIIVVNQRVHWDAGHYGVDLLHMTRKEWMNFAKFVVAAFAIFYVRVWLWEGAEIFGRNPGSGS